MTVIKKNEVFLYKKMCATCAFFVKHATVWWLRHFLWKWVFFLSGFTVNHFFFYQTHLRTQRAYWFMLRLSRKLAMRAPLDKTVYLLRLLAGCSGAAGALSFASDATVSWAAGPLGATLSFFALEAGVGSSALERLSMLRL